MFEPLLGEICIFPYNFAPKGWALCDGQLLPIAQNSALFSILGVTYGGDGKSTFALPDLRGRVPMHPGQGNGLSAHNAGERGGTEFVTLTTNELPPHTHALTMATQQGETNMPAMAYFGAGEPMYAPPTNPVPMSPNALGAAGGSQPHNNMQPYLTFNFCIAVQGILPVAARANSTVV